MKTNGNNFINDEEIKITTLSMEIISSTITKNFSTKKIIKITFYIE